jgi:hypothetical protein
VVIHAGPFSEVHLASSGSRKPVGVPILLSLMGFLLLILNIIIAWRRWG